MIRPLRKSFVASACVLLVASCATPAGPGIVQVGELPPPVSGPYRVRVADVLEVSFFRTPELTQSRTVGPDGDITLSPVGRVRAAGMRLDELTRVVRELYLPQFEDPQVTISVEEFSALQVFVGGEVNAGGTYPWHQFETITPSVFMAVEMLPEGAEVPA